MHERGNPAHPYALHTAHHTSRPTLPKGPKVLIALASQLQRSCRRQSGIGPWALSLGESARSPHAIMGVMQLSARAEYALHALIELAVASGGVLVPAEQLARDQVVPPRHLELIMTELRRAGLVQSTRGPEGGFSLARPADQISLAEVVSAINGPGLGDHAN